MKLKLPIVYQRVRKQSCITQNISECVGLEGCYSPAKRETVHVRQARSDAGCLQITAANDNLSWPHEVKAKLSCPLSKRG